MSENDQKIDHKTYSQQRIIMALIGWEGVSSMVLNKTMAFETRKMFTDITGTIVTPVGISGFKERKILTNLGIWNWSVSQVGY
jgi:hypothetical protein